MSISPVAATATPPKRVTFNDADNQTIFIPAHDTEELPDTAFQDQLAQMRAQVDAFAIAQIRRYGGGR